MQLEGKTVLITGGTSGIGRALVSEFCDAGSLVVASGRDRLRLDELTAACPGVLALVHDLATGAPGDLLAGAAGSGREIDIVINNAGVQFETSFVDGDINSALIEAEIATNLTAPILLAAAAIPLLLKRPEAALVNVTSALALTPKQSAPVYCATKAGLRSFTTALRYQLDGTSVRVVEVIPPLVETAMTAGRPGYKIAPSTVAAAIVAALRSGQDEVWIGKARLLRRVNRWAPKAAARRMRAS